MIILTIKNENFWETGTAWSGSGRELRGNPGNPVICKRPRCFIIFYHSIFSLFSTFLIILFSFFIVYSYFFVCLIICLSSSTGLSFARLPYHFFVLLPRPIVRCIVLGDVFFPSGRARQLRSGRAQVGRHGSGGAAWVPCPHVPGPADKKYSRVTGSRE